MPEFKFVGEVNGCVQSTRNKMPEVEQKINIIESIHKKKKRADLETIYKEAKETILSKEDIEVLLDKLCENDVVRKVNSHGKFLFFVAQAREVQKKQKDSTEETQKYSIAYRVEITVNDNDNASDISGNNDWNTDDIFLKKNLHSSENISIYTNYLKGLCDLKVNSLQAQQANALPEHLKQENTFLKNELRETGLTIINISENVSRQNSSGESLKSKSDNNWEGLKSNNAWAKRLVRLILQQVGLT